MVKFFDRYILREIIPPFFLGLLVFTFVLLMNQILYLAELFIDKGVSFAVTAKILAYLLPSLFAFTIPMSVLMGILAGLSRLSSDREIVAFKTLGISNKRLLVPGMIFAFAGWLATSYLAMYLAPHYNYKWVRTLTESVLAKVQLKINAREFNEDLPGIILFIQDISPQKEWENLFVYFLNPPQEPRIILAKKGKLDFYPEAKKATLELERGTIHSCLLAKPEKYSLTSFESLKEGINVESLFFSLSQEKRVREKDIQELFRDTKKIRQKIPELEKERKKLDSQDDVLVNLLRVQRDYRSHLVEIHKKFGLPFVCFLFVFLGIPLGATTKKGGRTSGFTLSLAIILIYYILITMGEKLAMEGRLSPFLGMWGGNILLGLCGIYLFVQSSREKSFFPNFLQILRKGRNIFKRKAGGEKQQAKDRRLKPANAKSATPMAAGFRFLHILDRYIIRKYLAIFLLVFFCLLLMSVLMTFFERLDNIYEHNKPLSMLFEYIFFRFSEFIHYILPVTVLTTTLLCLGFLTKFNEVTAMKACGISLYRIVVPVMLLGILVSGLSFYLQERILPYSNKKAEEVWNRINDVPPRSYTYVNRRWVLNKEKDRIYHYSYFDPKSSAFSHLSVFEIDLRTWQLKRRIYAEKGYLRGNNLLLVNTWLRSFGDGLNLEKKERLTLPQVEDRSYFMKEWKEPAQMNFGELRQYTREIKEMGFETAKFEVDLNFKVSFPLVSLIMTFLGIPFAFSMGKRGALVGIGVSIIIAMVYWGAVGLMRSLGYVAILNPFLAAWGANLLFGLIGIYLLLTLRT